MPLPAVARRSWAERAPVDAVLRAARRGGGARGGRGRCGRLRWRGGRRRCGGRGRCGRLRSLRRPEAVRPAVPRPRAVRPVAVARRPRAVRPAVPRPRAVRPVAVPRWPRAVRPAVRAAGGGAAAVPRPRAVRPVAVPWPPRGWAPRTVRSRRTVVGSPRSAARAGELCAQPRPSRAWASQVRLRPPPGRLWTCSRLPTTRRRGSPDATRSRSLAPGPCRADPGWFRVPA